MTASSAAGTPAPTMLRRVTVVDTRTGMVTPNRDLILRNGLIAEIAPATETPAVGGAGTVVDATGKYVMPGFVDMHGHPLADPDPTGALQLMLANGITGFRQMSGSAKLLAHRRDGTLRLAQHGPALLAMPGALLTPMNAGTPADAIAAIRQQAEAGADFIKVGMVTPQVLFLAQAEARRLGIPILGHLPAGIDVSAAARGGFRSIEHLGPGVTILADCSRDRDELHEAIAARPGVSLPRIKIPFMDRIVARIIRKAVVNPANRSKPEDIAILQRAIDTFDEDRARELAAQFAGTGTWHTPTLIRERTGQLCDAPEFSGDPNLAYMAPATVKTWTKAAQTFARFPAAARATFRAAYDVQLRLTRILDDAGVRMLAGSDTVGAAWVIPGFSLHQEFDELSRAGLSPLRIIQMTTLAPAEFLGAEFTMGTVEAGKKADLVLLVGNPLDDIGNLHRITGVIRGGRHYSEADLNRLRHDVATANPAH